MAKLKGRLAQSTGMTKASPVKIVGTVKTMEVNEDKPQKKVSLAGPLKEGQRVTVEKIKNGLLVRKSGDNEYGWKEETTFVKSKNEISKYI